MLKRILHINLFLFSFLLTALSFSSCEESRVFDKNISTSKSGWDWEDVKTFDVFINDTTVTYNMFVNIRHTDAYPYNNMWLRIKTIFPDSTEEEGRVNLVLSEAGGAWTGTCSDGICFNSVPIQQNFTFKKSGKYTFQIQQDMRINPLPYIMNVGLKVEKFMEVK